MTESAPSAVTIQRQAEVLKVTQEQALEGFMYFLSVRASKAEKYPDYVQARVAALLTLKRLASVAAIVGEPTLETWLSAMETKAQTIAEQKEQERAA